MENSREVERVCIQNRRWFITDSVCVCVCVCVCARARARAMCMCNTKK